MKVLSKHISELDEQQLVALLETRDTAAFGVLYDKYAGALYGVIHRIVRSDEMAEDVLQEAFVRIWKSFPQYDRAKGRLFTWLLNIARNLAIDKTRSRELKQAKQNQPLDSIVHIDEARGDTTDHTEQLDVRDHVRTLKPEQRQIVDLIYFNGYTQSEVAEELNMPIGTVKTRLRAAIGTLRSIFGDSAVTDTR